MALSLSLFNKKVIGTNSAFGNYDLPLDAETQKIFVASLSGPAGTGLPAQLTSGRARIVTLLNTNSTGDTQARLAYEGVQIGDQIVLQASGSSTANLFIVQAYLQGGTTPLFWSPLTDNDGNELRLSAGGTERYRFIAKAASGTSGIPILWDYVPVETHTHPITAITNIVSGTATLDFAQINHNHSEELTITIDGAVVGGRVILAPPANLEAGLFFCGFVSADNTVTVRLSYLAGSGHINPAAGTWAATVINP
jgi:hypothetical protein